MKIFTTNISLIKDSLRWIKVVIFGNNANKAAQIASFGDDSTPPKNYKGVYCETLTSSIPVVLGYFNRNQITTEGEKRIFSVNSDGKVATYVFCRKDGLMELGGNTNFAVKYTEFKTEIDKLKSSLNDLINAYNNHIHVTTATIGATATPGVLSSTTSTVTTNSSDFSSAKNDKILTI